MTKQGVLLDPQEINRKMAEAEAEFVQEELFEADAPAVTVSARTVHDAYTALLSTTARARAVQLQLVQLEQQLQKDELPVAVYTELYHKLEVDSIVAALDMELAKINVDRVNALTHFFEIDVLANAK
jgi:hypothetical protein